MDGSLIPPIHHSAHEHTHAHSHTLADQIHINSFSFSCQPAKWTRTASTLVITWTRLRLLFWLCPLVAHCVHTRNCCCCCCLPQLFCFRLPIIGPDGSSAVFLLLLRICPLPSHSHQQLCSAWRAGCVGFHVLRFPAERGRVCVCLFGIAGHVAISGQLFSVLKFGDSKINLLFMRCVLHCQCRPVKRMQYHMYIAFDCCSLFLVRFASVDAVKRTKTTKKSHFFCNTHCVCVCVRISLHKNYCIQ